MIFRSHGRGEYILSALGKSTIIVAGECHLTSVSSTRSPTAPPPLRTLPTLTPSSSTFGLGGGGTGDGRPWGELTYRR